MNSVNCDVGTPRESEDSFVLGLFGHGFFALRSNYRTAVAFIFRANRRSYEVK